MTEMSDLRSGGRARGGPSASVPVARPLPPRPSAARSALDGRAALPASLPARTGVERKPRPDPGPLRIAVGLTGIATASALMTAFLGSSAGVNADTGAAVSTTDAALADAPAPSVRHVIKYVQLQPGQTAPPKAIVKPAAIPKPRVVVITTKQSGK